MIQEKHTKYYSDSGKDIWREKGEKFLSRIRGLAGQNEHYLEPPGGMEVTLQMHDFPHFQACFVSLVLALGPQLYL